MDQALEVCDACFDAAKVVLANDLTSLNRLCTTPTLSSLLVRSCHLM